MNEIIVLARQSSQRLRYTLDFVLKQSLGLNYQLVFIQSGFQSNNKDPKISYGIPTETGLFIQPTALLFEHDIQPQVLNHHFKNDDHQLFTTQNSPCDLGYDIFAATFYMLTRYEEYLPHQKDQHDRFTAKQSCAFTYNFLEIPVVDKWILNLKKLLQLRFPELVFKANQYQVFPTFDIDQAYAYLNRPILQNILGGLNELTQLNIKKLIHRVSVLANKSHDPFDSYDLIFNHLKKNHPSIKTSNFFLLHKNKGAYDKSLDWSLSSLKKLVSKIKKHGQIGLHPSYTSHQNLQVLQKEKSDLERVFKSKITNSRFHFLRFQMPDSYKSLIQLGIKEEFSMGYADAIGFRAGTSRSFRWFDLSTNLPTNLFIHPFCIMDVTLKNYLNLTPMKAILLIRKIQEELVLTKGNLRFIWHNSSMQTNELWSNWHNVLNTLYSTTVKTG